MSLRMLSLLAVTGAFGAASAALPGLASSEPATVDAVNYEYLGYTRHYWAPEQTTVGEGAGVTIRNETSVPHGVEWKGGPETPSCSGVPVGTSSTKWSGTCTFSKPGTYTFWCTVHHSEMTETVTVSANGTTTTSSTGTSTAAPPPPAGTQTSATPPPAGAQAPAGSPFEGGPAAAVTLAPKQHGGSVRGAVKIAQAGAGGRLEVDLLAARGALAASAHAAKVRVGRLVRSGIAAGSISFTVPLSAQARRALARHGQLALSVKLELTPRAGATVAATRAVRLRR